jgi:hypothetical protein
MVLGRCLAGVRLRGVLLRRLGLGLGWLRFTRMVLRSWLFRLTVLLVHDHAAGEIESACKQRNARGRVSDEGTRSIDVVHHGFAGSLAHSSSYVEENVLPTFVSLRVGKTSTAERR